MNQNLSTAEKLFAFMFIVLSVWWAYLYAVLHGQYVNQNLYWAAVYQVLAWGGGIFGLITAKPWGFFRSAMGRSIAFLAIGLLFQGIGQSVFSYYTTILHVDIPYPSLADVGYFGSIFFYVIGIASLTKVSGASLRLRNLGAKLFAIALPIIGLILSYVIFLQGYEFDWSSPLRVFLDFGYPLGEALYVSIAVLVMLLSWNVLGGIMRTSLRYLMMALIMQYLADFNFLYQAAYGTWINGGYGDYLYLFAYFLMAVSLAKTYSTLQMHEEQQTSLP